ncbi:MAG TPA: hypothetical protein VGY51_11950 [Acidimicrobiales bacterium]|jgi:hypothetical protein|nr:hypothetical protein [Acidimicrobiales bacterium]
MKHRQRWARLAVVLAATLALVAAGLLQTASGAGAASPGGTLTGTVVISGAPSGFAPPYLGVGACPAGGPPGLACPNPVYSLASGATYTLPLTAGTWTVDGFYEINAYGGAFLSPPQTVTIPSGGTVHLNFTVLYQSPATVKGTINVTGVPSGVTVYSISALLCPSFAPYNGVTPSIVCVNGYGQPSTGGASTTYLITGLPSGKWTAYPSYCTEFGCATNANAGKAFTLVAGGKRKVNLTTPFLTPAEGLLTATVTVTGAPAGFSAPVAFSACQVGTGICQSSYGYPFGGNSFPLLLATGQWTVNGRYLVPPFDNAISGPSQTVTITGGQVTSVALAVPYQVLGTAAGTIHVTGNQSRVPITAYTMIACPASAVGRTSPECVSEFSGPGGFGYAFAATKRLSATSRAPATTAGGARTPFNLYQLSTLTPGSWILYPGYRTVFGSYTVPVGTAVTITAGQTSTKKLTVPYQTPSGGVVSGKVVVIGAPANGFQSGARACSAPLTGTSCPNEQYAYNYQSGGLYQLSLAPGTWWVSGFVDVFGGVSFNETTSPPTAVTVTPGSRTTQNFTVRVALP